MSRKPRNKVLFTSHTANFSKFNRHFMRWFKEQGWEVHYASMGEEKVQDCDKHFTVPFTRSPFRLSNIVAYRQLRQIIDREQYDIIHTHTPMGSVVTRLAARAARKKGTRVIYTAHGFHFFKGAPLANWAVFFPIEWLVSLVTDDLILINSEDYERAQKLFRAKRTHWLKGGVGIDLSRFKPVSKREKAKLRKEHGYATDDFILIYIAEFIKRKNHRLLIDAMPDLLRENPKTRLLLCGSGVRMQAMKQLAQDTGVYEVIDFLGYRNDIEKLLQISDMGVSTSMQEGLPTGIIEMIESGLPVVSSDIRGARDVLDNKYLFRLSGGKDTLVKRINIVSQDTAVKTTHGVFYDIQTSIKAMADIYDI